MEEWSAVFTLVALAGVVLVLVGSWWAIRVLRARTPRPSLPGHDRPTSNRRASSERPSSGSGR